MSIDITKASSEIVNLSKSGKFRSAYDIYNSTNHPVICYYLGLYAYNNDYNDIAKSKFIQGAKFGMIYPNEYLNTLHSNAVGQCIFLLLEKDLIYQKDSQRIIQLIGLAYAYLSVSINQIGNKAYQSHESRAKLLSVTKYSSEALAILDFFGVSDVNYPLIVANDYYESYLGYSTYLFKAETPYTEELKQRAMGIFIKVGNQFEIKPSFNELRESAVASHKSTIDGVNSLLKFVNDTVDKNCFFY